MKTFALSQLQSPASEASPEIAPRLPFFAAEAGTGGALRVLMVDGDAAGAARVMRLLADHGFQPDLADCAETAEAALAEADIDLVLLETALNGEDGLSFCRRLALRGAPPVIILAARCEPMDRVMGLELGAQDCLPKECHPLELVARVRAVLRRQTSAASRRSDPAQFGGWRLNGMRSELCAPDGAQVPLSPAEMRFLNTLFANPDQAVSRERLREIACRGVVADRTIDVLASRLRRKIHDRTGRELIRNIRGQGYLLAVAA